MKEGHVWDYPHVKHLCGAGKLYVRLNISKVLITMDDTGSDVEIEQMIDLTSPSTSLRPGVAAQSTNLEVRERETSSTSSGEQSIDSKIGSLATLFPNAKQSDIIYAVMNYDNLDSAAEHLSELSTLTSDDSGACNVNLTGAETLRLIERIWLWMYFNITKILTLILLFR